MLLKLKKAIYLVAALLIMTIKMRAEAPAFAIKVLVKQELPKILSFVVEQRLALFREYPYLYEGTLTEENEYITWFSKLPHSAIAVAYLGEAPVGFASGTGFADFGTHFEGSVELFQKANVKACVYYYIAEVLVLPQHRGNRLSEKLVAALENYARECGYTASCLVTEEHDEHPLKPAGYKSRADLWHRMGYSQSALSIMFSWPTRQPDTTISKQEHKLDYWLKQL